MKKLITVESSDDSTFEIKVNELLDAGYKISSTSSSSFMNSDGDWTKWMAILVKDNE